MHAHAVVGEGGGGDGKVGDLEGGQAGCSGG